jgi:hypothetical protein
MGLQIQVFNAGTSREIDTAFAAAVRERADCYCLSRIPFSMAGVSNWSTWHRATRFLRSTGNVSLPKPAD